MYYKMTLSDHIRVPPELFNLELSSSVIQMLKKKYEGYISKELGIVIDVDEVKEIKEGVIIHGDGAAYHTVTFSILTFKPELQEVVVGKVKDIADFGAFISIGPIDGMIHISQTMDDFVSFGKDKVLTGRDSKRALKIGDTCRARIIAVSYTDVSNPKLGLTMRQTGLGKLEWYDEKKGSVPSEAKESKEHKSKGESKEGKKE
ncbi:DNA-directed RNA polymerase [Candidatus Woesearchaeota archaeon]|nr:DNA-directed RNA polymerase [Candidatus Woesearchaeota archaeon]